MPLEDITISSREYLKVSGLSFMIKLIKRILFKILPDENDLEKEQYHTIHQNILEMSRYLDKATNQSRVEQFDQSMQRILPADLLTEQQSDVVSARSNGLNKSRQNLDRSRSMISMMNMLDELEEEKVKEKMPLKETPQKENQRKPNERPPLPRIRYTPTSKGSEQTAIDDLFKKMQESKQKLALLKSRTMVVNQ